MSRFTSAKSLKRRPKAAERPRLLPERVPADPHFENYVATRAEADGESQPLQGERYGGYLMEVNRDRRIVLTTEMVPDEELSPQAL